jgi:hypothetical protein
VTQAILNRADPLAALLWAAGKRVEPLDAVGCLPWVTHPW